jgi:hypothetical protein
MPSVGTYKAQPVTRTFVVTQGPDANTGVYYFNKTAIDSWASDNTDVTKVSDGLYIVKNSADFRDTIYDIDVTGTYEGRKSLVDFGKEVIIGNEVNSRLIVLRRVQFWGNASIGGDGSEGYVCVENNVSDTGDYGRFTVRVARA